MAQKQKTLAKQIIRYKNRQEWLDARNGGIGASEVATVLGLNPFETPYQLWRRKKGLDAPKQENFAMKAGHYLEDAVARFYADATQCHIIKNTAEDFSIINPDKPFLRVSPDRLYWRDGMKHNEENKCVLECKITQMEIDEDSVPQHWFCQLQMNMGVAELPQGALAWLTMGRKFGFRDFMFDKEFYTWMIGEVEKFWRDNIIGKQEPTAQSAQDVLLKYNRHTDGKIVEVGEDIYVSCLEMQEIKERIEEMEEQKSETEAKIKIAFADAEAISYGGKIIATWKAPKPSSKFDAKAFQAAHPDLAREFIVPTQGARRLVIK